MDSISIQLIKIRKETALHWVLNILIYARDVKLIYIIVLLSLVCNLFAHPPEHQSIPATRFRLIHQSSSIIIIMFLSLCTLRHEQSTIKHALLVAPRFLLPML